jgi:Sec-independent protein translocase protein TatA
MDVAIILLVLLVLVLLWRGPSTLPRLGEALGQAVRGARRAADGEDRPVDGQPTARREDEPTAR